MKMAIAHLESTSPYSQSRHYADDVPKLTKELPNAYEERTWRNRMHVDKEGHVQIPGPAFANCLKTAAKRLKLQVPGKGRVEFTKYFEAGVMCTDGITLDLKADDVPCDKLFVPSDGRPGGGKRVTKYFPRIDEWARKRHVLHFRRHHHGRGVSASARVRGPRRGLGPVPAREPGLLRTVCCQIDRMERGGTRRGVMTMNFTPVPEREQQVQLLVDYLAKQKPGTYIGYVETAQATGVSHASLAVLLRVALRRLKCPYIAKKGAGVVLSSPDNSGEVSAIKFRGTRRAIARFGKVAHRLIEMHGAEMSQYNLDVLLRDVSLAGALKAAASAHHVTREAALTSGKPPAPMLPKKV